MTTGQDEQGLQALTRKIALARGVDCAAYKERCLKRRLAVRMRACGVHTYEAYGTLLEDKFHTNRSYHLVDRTGRIRSQHTEAELKHRRDDAELLRQIEAIDA